MNLEGITPSAINQIQKDRYYMIPFIAAPEAIKFITMESRTEVARG